MHAIAYPHRLVAAVIAFALVVLSAGVALAQEEATPTAATSAAPSAAPLEVRPEGSFGVLAFDAWGQGLAEPRPATTLTSVFLPEGRLEGETGCGTYYGAYGVDGDGINLRVISKGTDPCGTKDTEEAVAYSIALESVVSWRPAGSGLELLDESGSVRLILGEAIEPDLSGSWLVQRYAKPNGTLVEPLPGTPADIDFDSDGGVAGSTGCRFFEGSYETQGDRIVIAPIDTVGLPCEGEERRQERRLLRSLDAAVIWTLVSGDLVLSDGFGEPLVVLGPAPEPVASPPPAEAAASVEATE